MRMHARARAHTHTHLKYVVLIAFPLQQWLEELASLLHCMYIASLCLNFCYSLQLGIYTVVLGQYFSCRVFICGYLVNIAIFNCYYSIPAFFFQTHLWSFQHF